MAGEPINTYTVRCLLCDQTVTGTTVHRMAGPCTQTCANAVRVDYDPLNPRVLASDLGLVVEVNENGSEVALG